MILLYTFNVLFNIVGAYHQYVIYLETRGTDKKKINKLRHNVNLVLLSLFYVCIGYFTFNISVDLVVYLSLSLFMRLVIFNPLYNYFRRKYLKFKFWYYSSYSFIVDKYASKNPKIAYSLFVVLYVILSIIFFKTV